MVACEGVHFGSQLKLTSGRSTTLSLNFTFCEETMCPALVDSFPTARGRVAGPLTQRSIGCASFLVHHYVTRRVEASWRSDSVVRGVRKNVADINEPVG